MHDFDIKSLKIVLIDNCDLNIFQIALILGILVFFCVHTK